MKVTMSIDRRVKPYFEGIRDRNDEYIYRLHNEFENRGHDTTVVFSDDIMNVERGILVEHTN